jgi:hypothetical protein
MPVFARSHASACSIIACSSGPFSPRLRTWPTSAGTPNHSATPSNEKAVMPISTAIHFRCTGKRRMIALKSTPAIAAA